MMNIYTNLKLLSPMVILFALMLLTGCGDSNPVKLSPEEVQGRYDFTEFIFTPNAGALMPANVLDTLVKDRTSLLLLDGGQFALNYQFKGGPEAFISGEFTVTKSEVELKMSDGSESRLNAILLHTPLKLARSEGSSNLETSVVKSKDLSLFSDRYAGIPPVEGVLRLNLVKRE